jgi:hypothetical protein
LFWVFTAGLDCVFAFFLLDLFIVTVLIGLPIQSNSNKVQQNKRKMGIPASLLIGSQFEINRVRLNYKAFCDRPQTAGPPQMPEWVKDWRRPRNRIRIPGPRLLSSPAMSFA